MRTNNPVDKTFKNILVSISNQSLKSLKTLTPIKKSLSNEKNVSKHNCNKRIKCPTLLSKFLLMREGLECLYKQLVKLCKQVTKIKKCLFLEKYLRQQSSLFIMKLLVKRQIEYQIHQINYKNNESNLKNLAQSKIKHSN